MQRMCLVVGLDMLLAGNVRLLRSKVVLVNRMECWAAVAAQVRVVGRDHMASACNSASSFFPCPLLKR